MITFFIAIVLLLLGYIFYGKFVEKVFKPDPSKITPAYTCGDGVDFIPLGSNKNSFIQILSIAGAVHDYLTGMISMRNGGAHLPALASKFLGKSFSHLMIFFTVLLLVLVDTVFVSEPAEMINELVRSDLSVFSLIIFSIFLYHIIATILPVDKIIGRIYPVLGFLLFLSALGIGIGTFLVGNPIPELTFENLYPKDSPYYPVIFLTISCGALSGFHATRSRINNSEGIGVYLKENLLDLRLGPWRGRRSYDGRNHFKRI